ncbi:Uncharacterised protein [Escherichia coli]|nr:Uncharacterised protein [Escherichia coli]
MNAYYIQDRLEAQSWRVTTSRSPVKRKRQNWQTTWKKACPSTCLNRYASIIYNATGPAKKPLPVRLMTMLSFRSAWQNTSVHS